LPADGAARKFGKNIGAPVCGRYGHVFSKPGLPETQENKILKYYAERCGAHGLPLPPEPEDRAKTLFVALPDPDVRVEALDPAKRDACTTCATCRKYIPPDEVAKDFGWTEGMCSAKGKLLLSNRLRYEARECEYREFGSVRRDTSKIALLPVFEDAFGLNVDPVRAFFKSRENFVEPHEYPTDKEVTPEETTSGIRAWRKVGDPEGSGNEVFLPIYRLDYFTEEERAKIPKTGDDEHPELYVDHFGGVYLASVAWTELDETPAAWGEAGVGKTELFRHLAWLMCLPFERMSITAQTEVDELMGKMLYDPTKGTYFQYGRLPVAWGKPCVLVLDEPNVGPPEVWQAVRPLTDNSKQLVLDMNEGERIDRHPDCYLGMAMNPAWDVKNVGTNQISDADANRLFHVYIEPPPEVLEKQIIRDRVALDGWEIDDERLETVMATAKDIRAQVQQGVLPITWGVRPQIKVARAMRWFEPIVAYNRAIGDFLEPEVKEKLLDAVRANFERAF
jgi:MoxR-like ATPase